MWEILFQTFIWKIFVPSSKGSIGQLDHMHHDYPGIELYSQ